MSFTGIETAGDAYAAVAKGAAWLDKKCPDWAQHISLGMLDLNSPFHCVLGQTAECLLGKPRINGLSGYWRVVRRFGWRNNFGWAYRRGFAAWTGWQYEMLDIAWVQLIQSRRAQGDVQ